MKPILFFFVLSSILLTAIAGCKDSPTPPSESTDPCATKKPVSAEFIMIETGGFWQAVSSETDTTIIGSRVTFQALQDCDSYEWKVGTDKRTWSSKSFTLLFNDFLESELPARVSIRLIAKTET
jgi:hypothetical protein